MPNPASAPGDLPNRASYMRNPSAHTVTDTVTGLIWEANVDQTVYRQDDAVMHCRNKGPGLALTSGWRLPTPGELATIVDETTEMPSIYRPTFPGDTPGEPFWTSFPQAGSATGGIPTWAWYLTFFHGHTDVYPSSDPGCTVVDGGNCYKMWVKCVR